MLAKSDYTVDLEGLLGAGSYGVVHKAQDSDGKEVAAKRINFMRNKSKVPQAAKDLKKLIQLDHQNISRIFHVLEEEATIWVFMELCSHGDLIKYLQPEDASSSVSDNEKLKLMLDIAEGVEYLHSKNVIHRDIKPSNVLVAGSPATAKLTDFDSGKFLEEDCSTSLMTSNVGTQAFKASEFYLRTDGGKLEYHRNVDVYAMGLTFLAMIQNNPYLVPKLETPNEASELSPGYTIGMLMAERKRYKVEPLQVVMVAEYVSDPEQQLFNSLRAEIQKMTHVEPTERSSASKVVRDLMALTTTEERTQTKHEDSDAATSPVDTNDVTVAAQILKKSTSAEDVVPKMSDLSMQVSIGICPNETVSDIPMNLSYKLNHLQSMNCLSGNVSSTTNAIE